jgi:predicted DNA-binding protein (MmcQ/YjbR family)
VSLRASSVTVAHAWQARYPNDIQPSASIGRHGWNRVPLGDEVPDPEIYELIDMSYETVVSRLTRAKRPV